VANIFILILFHIIITVIYIFIFSTI